MVVPRYSEANQSARKPFKAPCHFPSLPGDGLIEDRLVFNEITGDSAYAQSSIALYLRVPIEFQQYAPGVRAGCDPVFGFDSALFAPVAQFDTRP